MKKSTLVIVTDGAHARIFERINPTDPLHQIQNMRHTHELTHIHGTQKPGRVFESGQEMRHAYEPKTDWHDHQKKIFTQSVSQTIIKKCREKTYSHLYLVCAPKIMGVMRKYLARHGSSLPKNAKEICKDLTHQNRNQIESVLSRYG